MSKTVNNSHRRQMRTVTPVTKVGRLAAGAAMSAGVILTGGTVAAADPGNADSTAAGENTTVINPVTLPKINIPHAQTASDELGSVAIAPLAGTISVALPEPEPEPEPVQTESRNDDEQSSRSGNRRSRDNDDEGSNEQSNNGGSSESSNNESSSNDSAPEVNPGRGESILATARSGIGVPYVWGGSTPAGWDCSGFVKWVYAQHGINLPHGASAQIAHGRQIPRSEARPGDLIYKPGHIGIYAGGNKLVDAGNKRRGTSEREIYSGNWTFYRVAG